MVDLETFEVRDFATEVVSAAERSPTDVHMAKWLQGPIVAAEMKEYYEKRAPEYDATSWDHPARSDEERVEQEDLLSTLASLPPATTVEVACGTGYLTRYLPGDVIATDYSESMLRETRRKDLAMNLVRADALRLPFRDRSCERVVAANFYGHLEPPQASAFLREARRVGTQVLIVDAAPGLRVSDGDFEERTLADGSRHIVYKRFFRPEDLLQELGGGNVLFAGRMFVAVAA